MQKNGLNNLHRNYKNKRKIKYSKNGSYIGSLTNPNKKNEH